jgi:branched-chain amino acid transport system permease protein
MLTGCCGVISVGQAGFMCVGAYTSAVLCGEMGISFWAALPISGIIGGLVGLLFGLPSIRLRGFYLIILTLAAAVAIPPLISILLLPHFGMASLSGMSVSSPSIGGIVIDSTRDELYVVMVVVVIATLLAINLSRSRTGRAFCSIRDNELSSQIIGVNVSLYRLLAFFVCCIFAGLGGSLWALWMPSVATSQFPFTESVWYLGVIIVGGMGSISGIFLGSLVVRGASFLVSSYVLPTLSSLALEGALPASMMMRGLGITPLLISVIVLAFLIFAPGGMIEWWRKFKFFYRFWPVSS